MNELLESYLNDRKQFVSMNGFDSDMKPVNCGVPQGSYINDFRNSLVKAECGHFADDTFIIFASKKLKTIESVLNNELKFASKWMKLNKLSLNRVKTQLIIFHTKRKKVEKSLSIKTDGQKIPAVYKVKVFMYVS